MSKKENPQEKNAPRESLKDSMKERLSGLGFRLTPAARWGTLAIAFLGLIAFTGQRQSLRAIPDIVVNIHQAEGLHFVDRGQVFAQVQGEILEDIKKQGGPHNLRLGRLERLLKENAFIKTADISQDLEGRILVEIEQSEPIARLVQTYGEDQYLTADERIIPVSPLYTARVMTIEGPGVRGLADGLKKKGPGLREGRDSAGMAMLGLIKRISRDEFWRRNVSGLELSAQGNILIYPQVGDQTIEFGNCEKVESKFQRLNAFYARVLPLKGWTKYSFVSVRYEKQIICR